MAARRNAGPRSLPTGDGHVRHVHSILGADPNLDLFETRLTAQRAHETRVRHRQVFHVEGLPAPRGGERWIFALLRGTYNFAENLVAGRFRGSTDSWPR